MNKQLLSKSNPKLVILMPPTSPCISGITDTFFIQKEELALA